MRCPNCEARIDVLDLCQECIEFESKKRIVVDVATHCKEGHEYTAENTAYRFDSGKWVNGERGCRRYCRTCRREKDLARKIADRDRKREAYRKMKESNEPTKKQRISV